MYTIKLTRSYKRSLKKINISGNKNVVKEIEKVVGVIFKGIKLEKRYKDHKLSGVLHAYRECHVKSDLLLIYQINDDELILVDVGSHHQLFG